MTHGIGGKYNIPLKGFTELELVIIDKSFTIYEEEYQD
jgi:hypothetical protein